MRPRLRLSSAIVALMATILVAAPVAASSPWVTFKQTGTNAFAFAGGDCTEHVDGTVTCDGQSIDVFRGKLQAPGEAKRSGEQVCYGEFSDTFDPNTGEVVAYHALFGCTLDAGTLTVDRLRSITLTPTVVDLTAIDCDPTTCTESPGGSTTVHGTWTGTGPIFTQKGKFKFDDGSCVQVNADKGSSREASFDGSIEATGAMMGEGSFTFRTNCPLF